MNKLILSAFAAVMSVGLVASTAPAEAAPKYRGHHAKICKINKVCRGFGLHKRCKIVRVCKHRHY